jgi:magnesium chelatase family protein
MIQRYISKVSGPLLDRIDIHMEVPAVQYRELRGGVSSEGSEEIRARVLAARELQHARFKGTASGKTARIYSNAQMGTRQVRTSVNSRRTRNGCWSGRCSSRGSRRAHTIAF